MALTRLAIQLRHLARSIERGGPIEEVSPLAKSLLATFQLGMLTRWTDTCSTIREQVNPWTRAPEITLHESDPSDPKCNQLQQNFDAAARLLWWIAEYPNHRRADLWLPHPAEPAQADLDTRSTLCLSLRACAEFFEAEDPTPLEFLDSDYRNKDNWLTVAEAAKFSAKSRGHISREASDRKFECDGIRRARRIEPISFIRYLREEIKLRPAVRNRRAQKANDRSNTARDLG